MARFKGRQSANVRDARGQGAVGRLVDRLGAGYGNLGQALAEQWKIGAGWDTEAEERSNYEAMFGPGSWERYQANTARLVPPPMSDREIDRSVYREPGYQPNYRSASEIMARDTANLIDRIERGVREGRIDRVGADQVIAEQREKVEKQISTDLHKGDIDSERADGIRQRLDTGGPFDPTSPGALPSSHAPGEAAGFMSGGRPQSQNVEEFDPGAMTTQKRLDMLDNELQSLHPQGATAEQRQSYEALMGQPFEEFDANLSAAGNAPDSYQQARQAGDELHRENERAWMRTHSPSFEPDTGRMAVPPTPPPGQRMLRSPSVEDVQRMGIRPTEPSNFVDDPQATTGTFSPPPDMAGAFAGGEQLSPKVVQTIIAESLGEGPEGMRLVAETIINRARDRGITPEEVVMERGQYAPHSAQYKAGSAINLDDPDNIAAATAAWGAAQSAEDPTMGSEFFNVTGTRAPTAGERLQPVWEHGKHTFWNDTSGVKVMQQNLAAAGLYDGEIDGDFGPATKAAADAFRQQLGTDDPMQALTALGAEPAVGQQAIQNILQSPESLPAFQQTATAEATPAPAPPSAQAGPAPVAATGVTVPSPFSPPVSNIDQIMQQAQQQTVPTPAPTGDYNDILDNGAPAAPPPMPPTGYGGRPLSPVGGMPADRSDLTQAGPRYDPLNPASAATPPSMADPYADFETTRANVRSPDTLRDMMGQAGLDASQWDAGDLGIPSQSIPPSSLPPLQQQQYEMAARRDWARPQAPAAPPPQYDTRQEQIQEGQYRIGAPYNAEAEAAEAAGVRERLANANPDRLLWDEREMASIARRQPIGPPESRNYRIGQGLRPDLQETVGIGGPDAPPLMAEGSVPPDPQATADIGLTAMPPDMSAPASPPSGRYGWTKTPDGRVVAIGPDGAPVPAPSPVAPIYGGQAAPAAAAVAPEATTGAHGGPGGNLSAADALDLARAIEGNSEIEPQGRALISQFLQTGGIGMDPKVTPWCAAMVNSALTQVGIEGTGLMTASSFAEWGDAVEPDDVQKGDVLYKMGTAKYAGDQGGHVGFATGNTRIEDGVLQYEMYGGNQSTPESGDEGWVANVKWVDASEFNPRRAPVEAQQVAAATTAAATAAATDPAATEQTMLSHVDNSGQLLKMAQAADDAGANNIEAVGGSVRVWQDAARTVSGDWEQMEAVAAAGGPGVSIDYAQGMISVAPTGPQATTSATTATEGPVQTGAAPAEAAVAAEPPAMASPVSTMRDVARAASAAGVHHISVDPATNVMTGYNNNKQPWTSAQQAQIAAAVPGITVDAGGMRITPAPTTGLTDYDPAAKPGATTGTSDAADARVSTPVAPAQQLTPARRTDAETPSMELDLGAKDRAAAADPYSASAGAATDIAGAVSEAVSNVPPNMQSAPRNPYEVAQETATQLGQDITSGALRTGAGYDPALAGANAPAAVPPPAAITGQVVAPTDGRVQLTAPPMSGKAEDDYLGPLAPPVTPGSTIAPNATLPGPDLQLPPATGPIMTTPVGTPAPVYPNAPVLAPVLTPGQPIPQTPDVPPAVVAPPPPPAVTPKEKPESFTEKAEKYSGRSRTFSDPIEYAARIATSPDGKFDHDKFWEDLGNRDLTQTQQTIAAKTAAQGHFTQNKFPNFMPNMSGMGNAVQSAGGNIPNPISALGNVFGSLFGDGGATPYSGGGPTGSGGYGYSSPSYNTFAQQGPPGSSGNWGGSYNGPGSGSYGGGGMGGSQFGGGYGGGGGYSGAGSYGGAGGQNIAQGIGGAFRNR